MRWAGWSLDNAPGLGGRIAWFPALLSLWYAIFDAEIYDRSRNTLKKRRIFNPVQIGSAICAAPRIPQRRRLN